MNDSSPVIGLPGLRRVSEATACFGFEDVDDADRFGEGGIAQAHVDRRLLPGLDAGRVRVDVESAANLDLPVQEFLGTAFESLTPVTDEERRFECPVVGGSVDPPW